MIDLNQFVKWQKQDKNRSVTIKIGDEPRTHDIDIYVYDYRLMAGQRVKSVDEIDLEAEKLKREKAEFERLKRKFEGV